MLMKATYSELEKKIVIRRGGAGYATDKNDGPLVLFLVTHFIHCCTCWFDP
jgi:hypothetical protein